VFFQEVYKESINDALQFIQQYFQQHGEEFIKQQLSQFFIWDGSL